LLRFLLKLLHAFHHVIQGAQCMPYGNVSLELQIWHVCLNGSTISALRSCMCACTLCAYRVCISVYACMPAKLATFLPPLLASPRQLRTVGWQDACFTEMHSPQRS
jgi:hypothetical protein